MNGEYEYYAQYRRKESKRIEQITEAVVLKLWSVAKFAKLSKISVNKSIFVTHK